jgi:serine/threonine protein kinase
MQTEDEQRLASLGCYVVHLEDFHFGRALGSGAFGDVYYAVHAKSGTECAIKKFRFEELQGKRLKSFVREVEVLRRCNSPFLLPFLGFADTVPFAIVTEFMPGGSLSASLHRRAGCFQLVPTDRSVIILGIADGMLQLHDQGIVHRDLKPGNILLDSKKYPRICDFGVAVRKVDLSTRMMGTIHWMAPEVLLSNQYDEKVDVYSFGVVLWEMVTGKSPWKGCSHEQIIHSVCCDHARPPIPPDVPPQFAELINQCWAHDPASRPSFQYIFHAFHSCTILFPGTDEAEFLMKIEEIDQLREIAFANPLTNEHRIDSFQSIALNISPPAELVEADDIPDAPEIERLETESFPIVPYSQGNFNGEINDFASLPPFLNRRHVVVELRERLSKDHTAAMRFVSSPAVSLLSFGFLESYEIVRYLLRLDIKSALHVNFGLMCESIAQFATQILHLYSLLANHVAEFDIKVFAPLLNHFHDFVRAGFPKQYFRILRPIWEHTQHPTIAKIFVAGMYSTDPDLVESSIRVLCAVQPGIDVPAEIVDYQFMRFKDMEMLISLLLRQQRPSHTFLKYLKPLIPLNRRALMVICELAGTYEGAQILLDDLGWIGCEESLLVVLVLMQNPDYRSRIIRSPYYRLIEGEFKGIPRSAAT